MNKVKFCPFCGCLNLNHFADNPGDLEAEYWECCGCHQNFRVFSGPNEEEERNDCEDSYDREEDSNRDPIGW